MTEPKEYTIDDATYIVEECEPRELHVGDWVRMGSTANSTYFEVLETNREAVFLMPRGDVYFTVPTFLDPWTAERLKVGEDGFSVADEYDKEEFVFKGKLVRKYKRAVCDCDARVKWSDIGIDDLMKIPMDDEFCNTCRMFKWYED
jgi:hypothetical protein